MGRLKILLLRANRQLWTIKFRIVAIALIASSAFAMFAGIYSAIDSMFDSRDAYYRLGNVADLELRIVPDDQANVPSFKSFADVKKSETRLLIPGHVTLKDGKKLATTLIGLDLHQANDINKFTIVEGKAFDPSKPDEVVIDRNMAAYQHLKIGDHLQLALGNDSYQLTVRGIGRSSEFLLAPANPNFFIPSKGSMGIIFANLDLIKNRLGFNLVNSVLFKFSPGTDVATLGEKIQHYAEKKLTIEELIPQKRQFSYLFMNVDLNAFAIFVPAVIIIFSLAAIIITFFLLFQWVMAQRQEIGLLKALGYEKSQLATAYAFPVLVMALLAVVFGSGLSFMVLMDFGGSYSNATGFPKPFLSISPVYLGLAVLGTFGGLFLASLWPQIRLMSLSPQDAVRADREDGDKSLGHVMGAISRLIHGRIWLTYPVRNILRSKGISLMTVLSIALAMGVSLSYFIAITSFKDSIVKNFQQDSWQIAVDFLTPVWSDELPGLFGQIKQIKAMDPYIRGSIRIVHNGVRKSSLMGSYNPATSMHTINILQGKLLAPQSRDGILLERKLARSLGVGSGDTVTIESQGHTYTATVDGVFSGTFPGESYTDLDTARKWMRLDTQLNGIFLKVSGDPHDLVKTLNNVRRVGQVTLKGDLAQQVVAASEEMMVIIYVSAAFSIAVTLLFLFTSATFTVLQRKNEYVLLRVLGFEENILSRMIYVEVIGLGLIAAVLAVPTGYVIAASLVSKLSEAWFTVTTSMSFSDVVFILGPAILLLPLSAWPVSRSVRSMSAVKTLRERLFG